jgi:hypothetical protein
VVLFHRPSFNIEPLIFYFSNLRGTCSLLLKNRLQRLKQKFVAYEYTWGSRCEDLMAESPFIFIADHFPAFPAGNWFLVVAAIGSRYLLIAETSIPLLICLNCSGRLIPAIGSIASSSFLYQLVGFPLSVICSGGLLDMNKPHILASVAETFFAI